MFESLDISASGLRAQQAIMNVISKNVANATTTRDASGAPNPYRRQEVLLKVGDGRLGIPNEGVSVADVVKDMTTDFDKRYEPGHQDAIKSGKDKGYVYYPNVNVMQEMVDLMVAARAYEANATAMEATKSVIESSLRILA
jgi:flagellar basal-body rod protein FlgC